VKLSRAASYAVEALAYLATNGKGRLVPSHEVARARGAPQGVLLKILGQLGRGGLIQSVQGPNGGCRLARAGDHISLLDVVEAVDSPLRGEAPEVGGNEALNRRLQAICDRATETQRRLLAGVSVGDLANANRKTRGRGRS
jgi:Rrf2 family protein